MAYLFPGMDPYLEHPGLWPGVHSRLIAGLGDMLTDLLPRTYWVDVEERLYIECQDEPTRAVRADVAISARRTGDAQTAAGTSPAPGFVAVEEPLEVPMRETYLVIRHLPDRDVVTVIEVLSPANKHSSDAADYRQKRREVLEGSASLVEIDLLRAGERPAWASRLPACNYLVAVHRAWERPRIWARGWGLAEPIPAVPVPLRAQEPSVPLPLGDAIRRVHERGGYDRVVDYRGDPVPALPGELAAWVRERVASAESGE